MTINVTRPTRPVKRWSTVVTAWFAMKSKFNGSTYETWMNNMLSMSDAMVIFTDASSYAMINRKRKGFRNSTSIVVTDLAHGMSATRYGSDFWDRQFACDPERER